MALYLHPVKLLDPNVFSRKILTVCSVTLMTLHTMFESVQERSMLLNVHVKCNVAGSCSELSWNWSLEVLHHH